MLEALSVGRPIITTNAVGCREVIKNNKNGFRVKIKDANSLFLAIKLFHKQSKKEKLRCLNMLENLYLKNSVKIRL